MAQKPEIFAALPTVYAVADKYIIIVPVNEPCLMWVGIGENEYYDDSNGILRSGRLTHKMTVPMAELDAARSYTVRWRKMIERKPYRSEVGEIEEYTSAFRPIDPDKERINIYNIADAHNRVEGPINAGKYFERTGEELDLLLLNGDIPNHSGDVAYFEAIHRIAAGVTGGEIPVVFARGNHDTRGVCAELIEDYTPTDNGVSYYTFRLGPVWGIVMDCAEDKPDDHIEYAHTICCEDFRRRETRWLEALCNAEKPEYSDGGIKYKIVVVHNPFTERRNPPFDIEEDTFAHWASLLRENVKPHLMICGHVHKCYVTYPGGERDAFGQPCPIVAASKLSKDDLSFFVGGAITLDGNMAYVRFTDNDGNIVGEETVKL